MKLTLLEGTPDEIKGYLEAVKEPIKVKLSFASEGGYEGGHKIAYPPEDKVANTGTVKDIKLISFADVVKEYLSTKYHWSVTKNKFIPIKDMNSIYILNVMRKMLNRNGSEVCLEDEEFQALATTLGQQIVEDLAKRKE